MLPAGHRCLCRHRSRNCRASVVAVSALWGALVAGAGSATSLTLTTDQSQQGDTIVKHGQKSQLEPVMQSDPSLLGRADPTEVNIIVKLGYEPIASYGGGIAGLAATNPQKTGKKLKENKVAVDAYTRYVIAYESDTLARIKAKIPSAKITQSFRAAYGGVAMTLPANRIDDLVAIDGVVAVQKDSAEQTMGARTR